MRKKELIDIYILKILANYASQDNPIFQKDVKRHLEDNYLMKVSRKTLGGYIACLRDNGYVNGKRGIYKINNFTDNELRVLIDSVLYSQSIPKDQADALIDKLRGLSPVNLKNTLRNTHYVKALNRTQNDNLYPILDKIDEAIEKERKVEITRCLYNEEGQLEDVRPDIIHPYYIVTSNSRYYVICSDEKRNILENKRIDRISKVKILDEIRKPLRDIPGGGPSFDLGKYMREHVYMFSGQSIPIRIKIRKKDIGIFIDWYGDSYTTYKADDDEYIIIRTINNENATYYWALQYGAMVEVLEPLRLRRRIKEGLKEILNKYQ